MSLIFVFAPLVALLGWCVFAAFSWPALGFSAAAIALAAVAVAYRNAFALGSSLIVAALLLASSVMSAPGAFGLPGSIVAGAALYLFSESGFDLISLRTRRVRIATYRRRLAEIGLATLFSTVSIVAAAILAVSADRHLDGLDTRRYLTAAIAAIVFALSVRVVVGSQKSNR